MGYLPHEQNTQPIVDTLIDFFTISKSKYIYYFSVYPHGTGFSNLASRIFDIEIKQLI